MLSKKKLLSDRKFLGVILVLMMTCGLCVFSPMMVLSSVASHIGSDFRHQCDSAVGPDPSTSATTAPPAPAEPPDETAAERPSTNPYASLTIDPHIRDVPQRYRACLPALRAAPYQIPGSIRHPNSGVAVSCAQLLALDYAQRGTGDAAALARDVIYAASMAPFSGQCLPAAAPAGSDQAPGGCGDPSGARRAILLPETVGRQAVCGQRVAPSAVTAGDMIFWDYRDNAATRVGIAVSAEEMVTGNPGTGRFFRQAIPDSTSVRVKRVLGGEL